MFDILICRHIYAFGSDLQFIKTLFTASMHNLHLADTFIQSDLQCIQTIHFYQFVSGYQTHNLCNAKAMIYLM